MDTEIAGDDHRVGEPQVAGIRIVAGVPPPVKVTGHRDPSGKGRRRQPAAPAGGDQEGAARRFGHGIGGASQLSRHGLGEAAAPGAAADHEGDPRTRQAAEAPTPLRGRDAQCVLGDAVRSAGDAHHVGPGRDAIVVGHHDQVELGDAGPARKHDLGEERAAAAEALDFARHRPGAPPRRHHDVGPG